MDVKDDNHTFLYYRLSKDFMACGYAGCYHLKVKDFSEKYVANLKKANDLLKAEYKNLAAINTYEKSDKTPYFRVFIYNKDYDFAKLGLGYKFNENWAKLQTKDAKRRHAIYDGTLNVPFDWEHAADVGGLKLTKMPKSLEGFMGEEEPVEGNAKDYSIVIVLGNYLDTTQDELDLMFEQNKKEGGNLAKRQFLDDYQFLVIDDKIRLFSKDYEGKITIKELP